MSPGPNSDASDETRPAPSVDAHQAFQAIRGHTALRESDFTAVWFKLPQVRNSAAYLGGSALLVPLVYWQSVRGNAGPMPLLAIPIVFAALGYGLRQGRKRWAAAALTSSRGNEGVEYLFDEQGFHVKAPGREARIAWDVLYRHLETETAFVLFTTPQIVTVLPKRAFAEVDQERLRSEFARRIPVHPAGNMRAFAKTFGTWLLLVLAFLVLWQLFGQK